MPQLGTKNVLGYLSMDIIFSLHGTGNVHIEKYMYQTIPTGIFCAKSMPGALLAPWNTFLCKNWQEGYHITTSLQQTPVKSNLL